MFEKKFVKTLKKTRGSKYHQTKEWLKKQDHHTNGRYLANINTHIYHDHGCQDIKWMNTIHKIPTNNNQTLYRPCSHCKPNKNKYQITLKTIANTEENTINEVTQ